MLLGVPRSAVSETGQSAIFFNANTVDIVAPCAALRGCTFLYSV